jgi:Glycosyltransferase family 10 (fucosyltransferase) C-term
MPPPNVARKIIHGRVGRRETSQGFEALIGWFERQFGQILRPIITPATALFDDSSRVQRARRAALSTLLGRIIVLHILIIVAIYGILSVPSMHDTLLGHVKLHRPPARLLPHGNPSLTCHDIENGAPAPELLDLLGNEDERKAAREAAAATAAAKKKQREADAAMSSKRVEIEDDYDDDDEDVDDDDQQHDANVPPTMGRQRKPKAVKPPPSSEQISDARLRELVARVERKPTSARRWSDLAGPLLQSNLNELTRSFLYRAVYEYGHRDQRILNNLAFAERQAANFTGVKIITDMFVESRGAAVFTGTQDISSDTFSVIVVTHDAKHVAECVSAVWQSAQTAAEESYAGEVLLVSGSLTKADRAAARTAHKKLKAQQEADDSNSQDQEPLTTVGSLQFLSRKMSNESLADWIATGRNLGATAASNDILFFVDCDGSASIDEEHIVDMMQDVSSHQGSDRVCITHRPTRRSRIRTRNLAPRYQFLTHLHDTIAVQNHTELPAIALPSAREHRFSLISTIAIHRKCHELIGEFIASPHTRSDVHITDLLYMNAFSVYGMQGRILNGGPETPHAIQSDPAILATGKLSDLVDSSSVWTRTEQFLATLNVRSVLFEARKYWRVRAMRSSNNAGPTPTLAVEGELEPAWIVAPWSVDNHDEAEAEASSVTRSYAIMPYVGSSDGSVDNVLQEWRRAQQFNRRRGAPARPRIIKVAPMNADIHERTQHAVWMRWPQDWRSKAASLRKQFKPQVPGRRYVPDVDGCLNPCVWIQDSQTMSNTTSFNPDDDVDIVLYNCGTNPPSKSPYALTGSGTRYAYFCMEHITGRFQWVDFSKFDIVATQKISTDIPLLYIDPRTDAFEPMSKKQYSGKHRQRLMAIFLSGNATMWRRYQFVSDLMGHMKVDSYGKELNNMKDESGQPLYLSQQDKYNLYREYKFVLALENTLEEDYVSEKLWEPLYYGAVPVYLGATNIDKFLPHHDAVVHASDFKSPAELASYLLACARSPKKYKKHNKWRNSKAAWERIHRLQRQSAFLGDVPQRRPDRVERPTRRFAGQSRFTSYNIGHPRIDDPYVNPCRFCDFPLPDEHNTATAPPSRKSKSKSKTRKGSKAAQGPRARTHGGKPHAEGDVDNFMAQGPGTGRVLTDAQMQELLARAKKQAPNNRKKMEL